MEPDLTGHSEQQLEQVNQPRNRPFGVEVKPVILVVDDDAMIREISRAMLNELGYLTVEATNGAEGLQTFTESSSNLGAALVDFDMPVLDGAAMISALRKIDGEFPVILTSGNLNQPLVHSLAMDGRCLSLPKPYSLGDLQKALTEIFKI